MYYKLTNLGKPIFENLSILYKKFIFDKSCILYKKPLLSKVFISYLTFDFPRQFFHYQFLNRKCIPINNEKLKKSNQIEFEEPRVIIKELINLYSENLPSDTLKCCLFSLCIRNFWWKKLLHR